MEEQTEPVADSRFYFAGVGVNTFRPNRYWTAGSVVALLLLAVVVNTLWGYILLGILAIGALLGTIVLQTPRPYVELTPDHLFENAFLRRRRFPYYEVAGVDFSRRSPGLVLRSIINGGGWLLKLVGTPAPGVPREADGDVVQVRFRTGRRPLELWLEDGPKFVTELRGLLDASE